MSKRTKREREERERERREREIERERKMERERGRERGPAQYGSSVEWNMTSRHIIYAQQSQRWTFNLSQGGSKRGTGSSPYNLSVKALNCKTFYLV